jgi:hypothetical protein
MLADSRCSIWKVAEGRFAITPLGEIVPLLGYVVCNPDGTWSVERKGRVVGTSYPTQTTAIGALLELEGQ